MPSARRCAIRRYRSSDDSGHHRGVTRFTVSAAATLLLGSGALLGVSVEPASAAGCSATITVDGGPSPQLSSSNVSVARGDCVTFVNKTSTSIDVVIKPFNKSIAASKSANYPATATGTHKGSVSYSGDPIGLSSSPVSVDVTSAPASSSSPTPSHSTPSTGRGGGHGKNGGATGPEVANKPKGRHGKKAGAGPGPSPTVKLPPIPPLSTISPRSNNGTDPLVAPGQTLIPTPVPSAGVGTVSPSPAAATVHASSDGPSRGLPAAIAAVLILGVVAGLARVLRSPAVDNGSWWRRRR